MLGNQRINIAGKYFDDTDAPIDVKIAGLLWERMVVWVVGVRWCNVGVGLDGLRRFAGQSTYQHRCKVL